MKEYTEIGIKNIPAEKADLLIGLLSELGFYGFEQIEDTSLKAFIEVQAYVRSALEELAQEYDFEFQERLLQEQNWNALWESNFEPIRIDDFVGIRADFHPPFSNVAHDITITPKMSFGTGHHATTHMMIQRMQDLPLCGATVFDFGTGTGVLAIIAEKLGAESIVAIDNDEWSIRNAEENFAANNCHRIELALDDKAMANTQFDIVLANINKNVIISNWQYLVAALQPSGYLVLSGLLVEDEVEIIELSLNAALHHRSTNQRKQWISIVFQKQ